MRIAGKKAQKGSLRLFWIQLCIFLSGLSVFAQLYLFQPLLPKVSKFFDTSIGTSSFLVSASTIGMAAGLFFFSFNADNYPRKKVMVFALMVSALLTLLSAFIPDLPILIFLGILKGFIVSGVSAVALAYILEEIDSSVAGTSIGFYLSGNIIGGMSGRILASLIAGAWNWQMAVLGIGIESLLLGIAFWKFFPKSKFFEPIKRSYYAKTRQMGRFLKEPYLLCLFFIAALLMGIFVSVYNYISFRLENPPFQLSNVVISFVFVMYIFGVVGTMVTHRLAKHFRPSVIMAAAILLVIAGCLLLLSTNLILVILGIGLMTLCFFTVHTAASQLVAEHAKEGKSAATSIYWLFYYLGSSALGSGTGFVLHATSWAFFIWTIVGAILVSLVLVWMIRKRAFFLGTKLASGH